MGSVRFRIGALTLWVLCLLSVMPLHAKPRQNHVAKLSSLRQKMVAAETEIRTLIHQKSTTTDEKELKDVLRRLADRHRELSELAQSFEEERQHVRFQHPDHDVSEERQYSRYNVKSLKEFENQLGLNGRLDRIKNKVVSTFPLPPLQAENPQPQFDQLKRDPASDDEDESEVQERIKLVK